MNVYYKDIYVYNNYMHGDIYLSHTLFIIVISVSLY